MRIKRFIAPDMRTALRMIREEQGPDAVILSNRPVAGGIEVVAATDYDEALVAQALRAAAPALESVPVPAASRIAAASFAGRAEAAPTAAAASAAMGAATATHPAPVPTIAALVHTGSPMPAATAPATVIAIPERESLMARARAVFRTSEGPTLAELSAAAAAPVQQACALPAFAPPAAAPQTHPAPTGANAPILATATATAAPQHAAEPTRFEAMMAALNANAQASAVVPAPAPLAPLALPAAFAEAVSAASPPAAMPAIGDARSDVAWPASRPDLGPSDVASADVNRAEVAVSGVAGFHVAGLPVAGSTATNPDASNPGVTTTPSPGVANPGFAARAKSGAATSALDDWSDADADYHVILSSVAAPVAPVEKAAPVESAAVLIASAPVTTILHAVATSAEPDPAMAAMRADLATMRQLMERQMETLSLERLRGSPARAAAYEALIGYGCEDVLAQAVAAKIDPRLEPSQIHAPMFAELARMITVARSEPIDEGGVIALVGPTGAGKTTTAAKLAARFAARHRARDVALVTTDGERAGAREQLHAHGRRLGITVCEAAGPEGLADALVQLADYPLVLVDTTGFAPRDRALFGQILWLRAARKVRCLLVLPANAHPHDLGEVIRRYRPASPEAVVLTKLDETGRLGSALSVTVRHGLTLAYTTHGQQVPADIDLADATRLAGTLEKLRRAADNPLATDDRATEDRSIQAPATKDRHVFA